MSKGPADSTPDGVILGIESSCDETACALVRNGRDILASVVSSQVSRHAPFGGVVPEIASRAHTEEITRVIRAALVEAGCGREGVTAVAVTTRPGLIGSLLVGLTAAKALAFAWDKPLIPVDHLHAHAVGATLAHEETPFPAVALVVSGGHTTLLAMRSYLDLRFLGGTTDDAAGEAFDKVAQLLELGYPGGPAVSRAAGGGDPAAVSFPRSLLGPESLDFSFSGLKTAVLYFIQGQQGRPPAKRSVPLRDVAASFQEAVVDTLVAKCARALDRTRHRSLLVGGGVAANERLREKLRDLAAERDLALAVAKPEFCTDNAAMVAACGWHLYAAGIAGDADRRYPLDIDADPNSSLLAQV